MLLWDFRKRHCVFFYLFKIKVEQRSLSLETKNLKPAQIHCVSRGTLICRCMCAGLTCTFVNIVWKERVVISFIRLTVSSPGQIMLRCNKYSRYFARCLVIQQYKEIELGFWKVLLTRRLHYSPKKRKSHLEHKSHHENHTDTRDYIAMIGNDEFMAENRGILARFSSARHFFLR